MVGLPPPLVVCYRNAEGLTWDGQGEMPAWLKRADMRGSRWSFTESGSAFCRHRSAEDFGKI